MGGCCQGGWSEGLNAGARITETLSNTIILLTQSLGDEFISQHDNTPIPLTRFVSKCSKFKSE